MSNPYGYSEENITLRDYLDTRLDAMDKATLLAYQSMERRLDSLNEFRGTLRDQNQTFVTKNVFDTWKERMDIDIRELREHKAQVQGKASQSSFYVSLVIAILSLAIAVFKLFF